MKKEILRVNRSTLLACTVVFAFVSVLNVGVSDKQQDVEISRPGLMALTAAWFERGSIYNTNKNVMENDEG